MKYPPGWRSKFNGEPCPYCAVPMHMDDPSRFPSHEHVEPKSKGGKNDPSNALIACATCNHWKGNKTLEQFWRMLVDRGETEWAKTVAAFIAKRKPQSEAA